MLCQECRALFQKYGVEKYYSNIPDYQIELDKLMNPTNRCNSTHTIGEECL